MKNKLIKTLCAATLLTVSCTALAGCGNSNSGKTVVTFWHTMGQANQQTLNNMIAAFNAIPGNENIKIEHDQQGGYADIYEKLQKAIPAKTTPVMAYCYPDHVADYIDAGAAVKLDDLINDPEIGYTSTGKATTDPDYKVEDDLNDFITSFLQEGREYSTEGTYSLPFSKSTEVLFYNETYLVDHGYVDSEGNAVVPTKWENESDPDDLTAIINLARKIKANDSAISAPLGYDSDDNLFITFAKQLGLPYTSIGSDGRGQFDFNTAKVKAMVEKVKGWYDEGLIKTQGTIESQSYTSTYFKKQQLIFSIGSTGGTTYNEPSKDSDGQYEFQAKVAAIPQWGETSYCISQGPSIVFFQNKKISDEQLRAAFKFYKFITNPENSAAYSILTGYEPVKQSSYTTSAYVSHLNPVDVTTQEPLEDDELELKTRVARMTQTLKDDYFVSPAFVGSATARTQVGGIITQVLLGQKGIDLAFNDALTQCAFALPLQ